MKEIFNFYDDESGELFTPARCGYIGVALYLIALSLIMFLITLSSDAPAEPYEDAGSIVISLGEDEHGAGDMERVAITPLPKAAPTPQSEPVVTAPESEVELPSEPEPVTEMAEVERREVNRAALFPGTSTAESQSKGVDESKLGNQGSVNGALERSANLSEGLTGDYSLAGRNLVGSLPAPRYGAEAEGRVVISISVDDTGRVTTASLRSNGSTTNNSILIEAAREAALKARFTPSKEFVQNGTITYIFKMR